MEEKSNDIIKYNYASDTVIRARHPQGLGRIIRRQEFASEFGYFLKSNTSPRSWFGTLKVLEKFKFAISRFINLLQSSNFGLFPFLNGSIRSAMEK